MRFFFQRWSGFIRGMRAPSGSLGGSGRTRWLASALSQGPQTRAALRTKLFFGRGVAESLCLLAGLGGSPVRRGHGETGTGKPPGPCCCSGEPPQAPAPLTDQQGAFEPEALPLPVAHALLWPVGSPPPGIHPCERLLSLGKAHSAALVCAHRVGTAHHSLPPSPAQTSLPRGLQPPA